MTVTVSTLTPASGASINPGETFTFKVRVANATAADGGIILTNVRYSIRVPNPNVIKIRVPSSGTSLDGSGNPISAGSEVGFFEFNPASPDISILQIGETDEFTFTGRAGSGPAGGSTTIVAKILADPDINALFPRNEDSSLATRTVTVVG
ncbi:hypothetical protein [Geodermatophilus sp. SYSU D00710]